LQQITGDLAGMTSAREQAIKSGHDADAASDAQDIERYKKYLRDVQALGTVLAGASLGYGAGQQSGNAVTGAVIGGIGGAVTGAEETKNVWGAIAGGFAGVVGGLLGAADAHRQAAAALQRAAEQMRVSLAQANVQAGTESPVQGAIDQARAQFDALYDSVNAALPGLKNQTEREKDLAQVRLDEAITLQRIVDNFFGGITQGLNALRGPAGDYQNSLAALKKTYDDNVASAQALLGPNADLSQITALYTGQVAKLTAAYNETNRQTQFSLDARELYAKGLTAEGDALTRRAQEDKELFDAEQAGYTDAQIAQLTRIQLLEDEAAALKRYNDAAATLAKNLAAGPNGTLSQQQAADLKPLTDKYTADVQTWADAVARGAPPFEILTDYMTAAGDAAGIAAQQWQNAVALINQSNTDIANAVSGGHITGQAGLDAERHNFGFDGLSNDAINALYTDPTKGELTNDQREKNREIDQFFKDATSFLGAAGAAGGGAGSGIDSYNNVATGTVMGISSTEANGLLGRVDTSNTHLASIEDMMRRALFSGDGASLFRNGGGAAPNGGGVTLVLQISAAEADAIYAASPTFQSLMDTANGRGLTRQRAGAGATRR
jgi:hypothetical protein